MSMLMHKKTDSVPLDKPAFKPSIISKMKSELIEAYAANTFQGLIKYDNNIIK